MSSAVTESIPDEPQYPDETGVVNATTRTSPKTDTEPPKPLTLGQLLRQYRNRMRQVNGGPTWTQLDVATVVGTDAAHINRIERDKCAPTLRTLERLCEALILTWQERLLLMSLAGFLVEPPPPVDMDISAIVHREHAALEAAPYGVCLLGTDGRLWDLNETDARLHFGFADRTVCLETVRGKHVLDLLIDPSTRSWYEENLVDYDAFARRNLARFYSALRSHAGDSYHQSMVTQIAAHPRLSPFWTEIADEDGSHSLTHFLDHQTLTIIHPVYGRYSTQVWHATLAADERFFLSHHVPADSQSRSINSRVQSSLFAGGPRSAQSDVSAAIASNTSDWS
jgi:transcriptional regulator with XRE-family HTH domain